MRSKILVLILTLTVAYTNGQIIDNRLGNVFKEEMYFSQEFLWQNKIKTVISTTAIKRTNRPIEQKPDLFVYRFNEVGLLHEIDKVVSVANMLDSLTIVYHRNESGEVQTKSESSKRGYFMTKFAYDAEGRIIRSDYGKAENVSLQKNRLEPGAMVSINSESYTWTKVDDNVWKKSSFNNYGLQYSNWTITKSPLGYVTNESEELVMSGKSSVRNYKYNEKGWVSEIETTVNDGSPKRREVFTYDEFGNLLKMESFRGSLMIEELEVLYTETMLIEAILRHDLQSHDINIHKFSYEYR
jgi:hypothetical protein